MKRAVEANEVTHEERLGCRAIGIEPAVRHRLAAARLVPWICDLVAEALQQLKRRNADLRKEGVNVAGYEESYAHSVLL
jgi:hypothetical protein